MRILLITAPGLRPSFLGCYGNDWVDTPSFDAIAAEGIVFDEHYADCLTGWPSMLTGYCRFGAGRSGVVGRTLLERCAAHGIANCTLAGGALTGDLLAKLNAVRSALGVELSRLAGASDWLALVELPSLAPPWSLPNAALEHFFEADDEESREEVPVVPLFDPPDQVDPEDRLTQERLRLTYASAVYCVDQFLADVLTDLDSHDLLDDVALVITADHAVALAEHGAVGIGSMPPHEELAHVPLLVRLPGDAEAGRRVLGFSQPVDLFPTVLELLGLERPDGHGRSLVPLLFGREEAVREYAFTACQAGDDWHCGLRMRGWTFLTAVSGTPRLFVRPDDRWEMQDVRQLHLDLVESLQAAVRECMQALSDAAPDEFPLRLPDLSPGETGGAPAEGRTASPPHDA